MSANVVPALLETTRTVPAAAVAWAIASSPSGWTARCCVVGAMPHGTRTGAPSSGTERSTSVTSRSTCGRKRRSLQPHGASSVLTESRAPCARYSKTGGGRASRARASRSDSQVTVAATPAKLFLPRRSTRTLPPRKSAVVGT